MKYVLWVLQVLLAALFLFAATAKFTTPPEVMTAQMPIKFPIAFVYFIGVCEILGAIGLILPSLLRIKPGLTPLAAAGLMIITIGATAVTIMGGQLNQVPLPLVTALVSAFVAYGRWKLVPINPK